MKRTVVKLTQISHCTCTWTGTENEGWSHQDANRDHRVRPMLVHPTHFVIEHPCLDEQPFYDSSMQSVLYTDQHGICMHCNKFVSVVREG